ncbi:hypothetical protein EUX98_g6519 [Antrodiella citrinella]|uniref:Alkaline phytoceramidase n=1 Tax=Antrodiella citrinella TaxID=2447956 RepID=A0A4S4MWA4_9APHY|nr:hypothetical protein EUX98_g6519 [Antrodiella citrinella]
MPLNTTVVDLWDSGFWGPVTATLDWCEANYQFSNYVAETANTFSNLFTMGMAIYGASQVKAASLPGRYLAGYTGFALVGLGSFIFHATLLYEAQLADELPMVYVATYCLGVLFDCAPGFSLTSTKALTLTFLYFAFNIIFTWSYAVYRNPIYHQAVFATVMLINAYRTYYLLRVSPMSAHIPAPLKTSIARIFSSGVGIFVFGFFVWNLDNIFCGALTGWKRSLGWPAAFLLEGHSWWHIFTALGTYLMIVGNTYFTLCMKGNYKDYTLVSKYGLPQIARSSAVKAKAL